MAEIAAQMPVSDARDHLGDLVDRARDSGAETILTRHGSPAAVIIGFEDYQRLKDPAPQQLPPEIMAVVEEGRRHPERDVPWLPRRAR